jgi:hypothetical protein
MIIVRTAESAEQALTEGRWAVPGADAAAPSRGGGTAAADASVASARTRSTCGPGGCAAARAGMGGDEYHRRRRPRRVQFFGEVKAALTAKVDIDEYHVRPQFLAASQCFHTGRGRADDRDALALQQAASGIDEIRAVIND